MSQPPVMAPAFRTPASGGTGFAAPNDTPTPDKPLIPATLRQHNAAVTQDIMSLKGRMREAEDEIGGLRMMVQELQSRDAETKQECEEHSLRLQQVEAHCNRLEAILTTYLSSQGVDLAQLTGATKLSELVVDKKDSDLTEQEVKDLKIICKESLSQIYGVPKFSPKDHGGYPAVSKLHTEWPSRNESGRRVPLQRFDFMEEYNSPKNIATFEAWVKYCLDKGPAVSGVHHLSKTVLNDRVLTAQCAKYYSSIKRQALTYHSERKPVAGIKRRGEQSGVVEPKFDPGSESNLANSSAINTNLSFEDQPQQDLGLFYAPILPDPMSTSHPVQAAGVADFQQVTADEPVGAPNLLGDPGSIGGQAMSHDTVLTKNNSKSNFRSRRTTKLNTREKKRPALTGDNDVYLASKYDSYFTIGAMSDEEQVETTNEKGEKVVELVSHEYEFASEEFVKCRKAVDAIPDPTESSKKLKRRRGSPRPGPPPKSKKADSGLHSWMIKADVLAKHPEWFTEGRVYPSGPKWGLKEVAHEGSAAPKQKKIKLETNPDLQLVQQKQADWVHAKEQLESWQNAQGTSSKASD